MFYPSVGSFQKSLKFGGPTQHLAGSFNEQIHLIVIEVEVRADVVERLALVFVVDLVEAHFYKIEGYRTLLGRCLFGPVLERVAHNRTLTLDIGVAPRYQFDIKIFLYQKRNYIQ